MSSEHPLSQLIHPADAHQLLPAYQLLTNAVAQRRQTFNSRVILHPITLAAYTLLVSFFLRFNLSLPLPTRILLLTGVTIALLSALRHYSEPFLEAAEKIATREEFQRRVLRKEGQEMDPKDVIMVLEWDHRVVGTCCVFGPQAEVWGWSVERRYRGRGLGKDLLVEAVKEWEKQNPEKQAGGLKVTQDCPLFFKIRSAPAFANKKFTEDEDKVRRLLKNVVAAVEAEESGSNHASSIQKKPAS